MSTSPQNITETFHSQIVDVRNPDEFLQEHIPGSRNIPLETLGPATIDDATQPIILTCRTGRRAEEAQKLLERLGCQNVSLLEGGLSGWKAAGKPTLSLKKGPSIMQQVQMVAGTLILIGSFVPTLWFLAPIVGLGLLTAGLTNTCMMAALLAKMPWNKLSAGSPIAQCQKP